MAGVFSLVSGFFLIDGFPVTEGLSPVGTSLLPVMAEANLDTLRFCTAKVGLNP